MEGLSQQDRCNIGDVEESACMVEDSSASFSAKLARLNSDRRGMASDVAEVACDLYSGTANTSNRGETSE